MSNETEKQEPVAQPKREWVGLTDDPENTLHWHALNYRTAPPQNAQKMFEALETFVRKVICETENRNIAKAEKQEPACPHIDEPLGCYRIRCQLGRKCVDAQSQSKAEKQEPVAWKETDEVECPVCRNKGFPWPKCGHITYLERVNPPQRTWQGLTEQDVEEVERWVEFKEEGSGRIPMGKLVRYIETKLREQNT